MDSVDFLSGGLHGNNAESVFALVGEVDSGELRGCQKREGDGANAEKWLGNLMKGLVEFFTLFF